LLAGGQKLDAGAGQLNSGAGQLNTGAGAAHTGSSALNDGLAKISAGEDKLAAGLPAAVTGSGKISDGAGKLLAGDKAVGAGLVGVKSKATSVLASQLSSGTENSKLQLAGLEATTARLTSDPAANTAYVLTQEGSTSGLKLAGNQSHVGRNIGLGVGGVLLLLAGLAVGFLGGRRRKVA
jgi:X-X-X-Leu-X-X-Gly heptad repeat protein